jgi:hypothetical protein
MIYIVGTTTGYRLDYPGFEYRQGKISSCLRNVQNSSAAHQGSYSMGTSVLFQGYSGRSVKLTTHLHLVSRSRMSTAIPLLPPILLLRIKQGQLHPIHSAEQRPLRSSIITVSLLSLLAS